MQFKLNEEQELVCEQIGLCIPFERIDEQNWFVFAIANGWDLNQFMPVYFDLCHHYGIESITFSINY